MKSFPDSEYTVRGILTFDDTTKESNMINKAHYKNIVLFIPDNWATADLTFKGCDRAGGDYFDVVDQQLVPIEIENATKETVITFTGDVQQALSGVPYLIIVSSQAQTDLEIPYVLMR